MALRIVESCTNCTACLHPCPCRAIVRGRPHVTIRANLCTECDGEYAEPQCASICPIEGAIVDAAGVPLNPPGSLTGIPPARLADARAEIRAR